MVGLSCVRDLHAVAKLLAAEQAVDWIGRSDREIAEMREVVAKAERAFSSTRIAAWLMVFFLSSFAIAFLVFGGEEGYVALTAIRSLTAAFVASVGVFVVVGHL